jgi:hypothetical protein
VPFHYEDPINLAACILAAKSDGPKILSQPTNSLAWKWVKPAPLRSREELERPATRKALRARLAGYGRRCNASMRHAPRQINRHLTNPISDECELKFGPGFKRIAHQCDLWEAREAGTGAGLAKESEARSGKPGTGKLGVLAYVLMATALAHTLVGKRFKVAETLGSWRRRTDTFSQFPQLDWPARLLSSFPRRR